MKKLKSTHRLYRKFDVVKGVRLAMKTLLVASFGYLLPGCNSFEFSPNQVFDRDSPSDLNARNIERLLARPTDDTVTIAFTGDSQRFYKHLKRFVDKANSMPNIDFVLLAGDISDFGMLQEFEWIDTRLSKLTMPYIGVIGNHDLVANGKYVYKRMFGPLNFTFTYGGIKFVAHDTNNLEYGEDAIVPKMDWLRQSFQPEAGVNYIIPVSHVPPFSELEFAKDLVEPYTSLLSATPNLLLSLHGHVHVHRDFYPYEDGVRYLTGFAFSQDAFVLLKIVDGKVFKQIVHY